MQTPNNNTTIRKLVKQQRKENSKSLYKILNSFLPDKSNNCLVCDDIIFYDKSCFSFKNNILKKQGKSNETIKRVNNKDYYLSVCQDCLLNKFPVYKTKKQNSDRCFNVLTEITKFAFNINDEDFKMDRKKYAVTLNKYIEKYGEDLGKLKYNKYCNLQSVTNSFEYKNKKYGWTREEFDKFNKSRAVTLINLIKRHGEKKGTDIFNRYKEKQSYAGNKLEYFIEKYGYIEGNKKYSDVCKAKGITLENMIRVYGKQLGPIKYKSFIDKTTVHLFSNISQELFNHIENSIKELNLTTYYATKNKEFGKFLKTMGKYVKLDYFIKELNLCIEFNGDLFHANPAIFKSTDKPIFLNKKLTAEDVWKKDELRYKTLYDEHHIKTIVVWESDYNKNKKSLIKDIRDKIWELNTTLNSKK